MKYIYITLLIAGFLSTGCKKLIDRPDSTVITTDAIFNTSRDLDNLLYGAYGAIANGSTLAGNWKLFPELLADNVVINAVEVLPADPYVDLYNRNMTVAQYPESWRLAYVAIQNANTVLYAVNSGLITQAKDAEFNDATKNRILGEAYFIRAICHFELVRLYGQPYGFNSTAANSGVILKTEPTLNASGKDDLAGMPRATVEAVYQQVISDLKLAENLMPTIPIRRGRATSYAAAAYLARVYFQQNDYANALTEIGKVIGTTPGAITGPFSLVRLPAVGTVTTATASSNVLAAFNSAGISVSVTENIFDLVSVTGNLVNPVITRKYFQSGTIQPHLGVSTTMLNNAAFAANDARRVNLMSTVSGKTYSKKFDNATMNVPVIRSAELVLDRAEINALNAGTNAQALADATKDINLIRDRAIPGYSSATVITAVAILGEVRRERIRELAFEGDRLHDLRRQQAVVGPGDRAVTTSYQWNSNGLLFKIPDAEILANPNIVQNPN
jgi:tetratricopeptide (TPR) repeat protein